MVYLADKKKKGKRIELSYFRGDGSVFKSDLIEIENQSKVKRLSQIHAAEREPGGLY